MTLMDILWFAFFVAIVASLGYFFMFHNPCEHNFELIDKIDSKCCDSDGSFVYTFRIYVSRCAKCGKIIKKEM